MSKVEKCRLLEGPPGYFILCWTASKPLFGPFYSVLINLINIPIDLFKIGLFKIGLSKIPDPAMKIEDPQLCFQFNRNNVPLTAFLYNAGISRPVTSC